MIALQSDLRFSEWCGTLFPVSSCAKGLPLETIHIWQTIDAMLSSGSVDELMECLG